MYGLLVFLVSLCSIGKVFSQETILIVNGDPAAETEFTFAVVIRSTSGIFGGGSIISKKFIVTAAHVLCENSQPRKDTSFFIHYGSNKWKSGKTIDISNIHCNTDADIAVAELSKELPNGEKWSAVKLSKSFDSSKSYNGVAIGWGGLWQGGPLSDDLRKINVEVYSKSQCNINHILCFGTPKGGVCGGDSGSALLVNNELAGVIDWITAKCGTSSPSTPNGATKVADFYNWIAGIARI